MKRENFSSTSTACASDQLLASRQREANSTAFQSAVNHPFHPLPITATEAPTGLNHHPVGPAHSTQITLLCNLSFQDNQLIYKRFSERSAPEVVRIIGPAEPASTLNCTIFKNLSRNDREASRTGHEDTFGCDHQVKAARRTLIVEGTGEIHLIAPPGVWLRTCGIAVDVDIDTGPRTAIFMATQVTRIEFDPFPGTVIAAISTLQEQTLPPTGPEV